MHRYLCAIDTDLVVIQERLKFGYLIASVGIADIFRHTARLRDIRNEIWDAGYNAAAISLTRGTK